MNNLLLVLYWIFFLSLFPSIIWLNRLNLSDWNGTNYNAGETTRVVLGAVAALGRGRALSHSGSSGCVLHAWAGRLGGGGGGRRLKSLISSFLVVSPENNLGFFVLSAAPNFNEDWVWNWLTGWLQWPQTRAQWSFYLQNSRYLSPDFRSALLSGPS